MLEKPVYVCDTQMNSQQNMFQLFFETRGSVKGPTQLLPVQNNSPIK